MYGKQGVLGTSYGHSTNAYMLVYRRVDLEKNKTFFGEDDLPQHVKDMIAEELELYKTEIEKGSMNNNTSSIVGPYSVQKCSVINLEAQSS